MLKKELFGARVRDSMGLNRFLLALALSALFATMLTVVVEKISKVTPIPHVDISTIGTFRTENLLVDNTTKTSGTITGCTDVMAGCIGKPNLLFNPTTGEFDVTGTGAVDTTFRSLVNVLKNMTLATADQQAVQVILDGSYDSTTAPMNAWAGEFGADVSRGAGLNQVKNIGLLLHARNGDVNEAIESIAGDWRQTDATATVNNAGHMITGDLSIHPGSPGPVDFTNATSVTLSNKLVSPIEVPGSTVLNPLLGLGVANANGEQLAIKNTVTGAFGALGGVGIGLDTTVDAGARGGLIVHRGAGGNFGGADAKAFWISYGNDLTPFQTAGDLVIFNQEVSKSILFVTGGTGLTKTPLTLKGPSAHWLADGNPPVASSCGTGTAQIEGSDTAFLMTPGPTATGCTVTFGMSYTNKPTCTVFPEGGAVLPTCTITAAAITCTVAVAAAVYHWQCIGKSSGDT